MLNIGIIDADMLDGGTRFPNLVLMKISAYHKSNGDNVELLSNYDNLEYDKIYLAKVFDYTKVPIDLTQYPNIEFNGTGFFYDQAQPLPDHIEHHMPDYDLYDEDDEYYNDYSIGYCTRGCFRKCSFCVNKKYDKVCLASPVSEFLDQSKKYICLLDDNILGYSDWRSIIAELIATKKRFQFKQGVDIRLMTHEKAALLSQVKYKGDWIFAFDHIEDAELISKNIGIWKQYCKKTTKLYVLTAYDSQDAEDVANAFKRIKIIFEHQCIPYIMRYKDYNDSPMRGMYITLARWCNQVRFVKKMSFREFAVATGGSAVRYLNDFEAQYPEIAKKYFDITYSKPKETP